MKCVAKALGIFLDVEIAPDITQPQRRYSVALFSCSVAAHALGPAVLVVVARRSRGELFAIKRGRPLFLAFAFEVEFTLALPLLRLPRLEVDAPVGTTGRI